MVGVLTAAPDAGRGSARCSSVGLGFEGRYHCWCRSVEALDQQSSDRPEEDEMLIDGCDGP